jgi:hypothetical protein
LIRKAELGGEPCERRRATPDRLDGLSDPDLVPASRDGLAGVLAKDAAEVPR